MPNLNTLVQQLFYRLGYSLKPLNRQARPRLQSVTPSGIPLRRGNTGIAHAGIHEGQATGV